jgi:O-antigen/teichoic acid export membrane protein
LNNIRFNTFLFAFLNFGERLIGFVTLPLITKTVSDSNYAVWTQTIITTGLLTPIIVFGCGTSLVKFYPLHKESIFKIIRVMFFVILSVFMVFATTTLIFKDSFSVLIFGDQSYSYLILPLLLLLLGEALFEFFVGFMRAKNIINFISLYLFLKGLLRLLILYIVLVILDKNMYEVIFYFSLTQLIFVLSLYLIHFPINKVFLYSAVIKIEVYIF